LEVRLETKFIFAIFGLILALILSKAIRI